MRLDGDNTAKCIGWLYPAIPSDQQVVRTHSGDDIQIAHRGCSFTPEDSLIFVILEPCGVES